MKNKLRAVYRRGLSLLIVLTMLVGMMPASLFTITAVAEGEGTEKVYTLGQTLTVKGSKAKPTDKTQEGTCWVEADPWRSESTTCGEKPHDHSADCVYTCSHVVNGKHLPSCYGGTWQYCPENDGGTCDHTESVKVTASNYNSLDTEIISAITAKYSYKIWNAYNKHFCYKLNDTLACDHQNGWDVHTGACCSREYHVCSEPDCYSYTWVVDWNTYNVTVTTSGKDDVTADQIEILTTSVQHSVGEFSCVIPTMGEIGWVATVINDGAEKTSVSLNADAKTTVTTKNLTSGAIEIKFSRATVYNVTLTNATPEFGQASF